MSTYLILNIIFVLTICIIFRIRGQRPTKRAFVIALSLLTLTFIFDSLLVYFHIVEYALDRTIGLRVGLAPIEDYFYPVLALILIPYLWKRLGKRHA